MVQFVIISDIFHCKKVSIVPGGTAQSLSNELIFFDCPKQHQIRAEKIIEITYGVLVRT